MALRDFRQLICNGTSLQRSPELRDVNFAGKVAQMADWIELKSAQLKSQEADQRADQQAARERRVQAAAAVDQLEIAVRNDIARWNELNPGYRQRIDGVKKLMPSGAFRLYKTSFPPAAVEAVLDQESFVVMVETTTVRPGGQEHTAHSDFMLAPEKNGFCLTLQPGDAISFADASRVLLEPILTSASFWARRESR